MRDNDYKKAKKKYNTTHPSSTPEEVFTTAVALTVLLSCNFTKRELLTLINFLNFVKDGLATIVAQREICDGDEVEPIDFEL